MARRSHDHLRLGRHGEDLAAARYRDAGWELAARNWRVPAGEIDLVAVRRRPGGGTVVAVVEVKTRSSTQFGSPFDAVGPDKQRRLRRLAATWLAAHRPPGPVEVRFDVVAVVGTRLDVVEGAF